MDQGANHKQMKISHELSHSETRLGSSPSRKRSANTKCGKRAEN